MDLTDPDLLDRLEAADDAALDAAPFGVVGMDKDNVVELYNAAESRIAGLSRDRAVGRPFFDAVAPCMNNFMVSQRFLDEDAIDAAIDYVLTLRMKPTRVRLRLLKAPAARRRYLLVQPV